MNDVAVPQQPRSLVAWRVAAALTVVVVLAVAYRLGVFSRFSDASGAAQTISDLGPAGYLAFIVVYTVLQPFGVPGTVFIVAAPLIWPWPIAFALSMTGTMAASVVGFSFARFVARDWVTTIIPARLKKYEDALVARAFTTVFLLRLIFWMPQWLHTFFGVSKVRFWTHFWGSLAGYAPPLLAVSFFGEKIFELMKETPPSTWIGISGVTALIIVVAWAVRRRVHATSRGRRRRSVRQPSAVRADEGEWHRKSRRAEDSRMGKSR